MKVRIYQGANARYRDELYAEITKQAGPGGIDITLIASWEDHLGVSSVHTTTGYVADYCLRTRLIGFGRLQLIWYQGWPAAEPDTDVVVIDGNPRVLNNYLEAFRCRKRHIPVIWWGQGFSAGSRGFASRVRIGLMRMRLFSHLLLYTDRERDYYLQLGFAASRVSALNNGINVDAVDAAASHWSKSKLAEFQRDHQLGGRTWVVFIGRLRKRSGVELLPEVLEALPGSLGLIIIGDGELRSEIEKRFTERQLDDRVRWAGALFSEELLAPWMLSATCMFYPGTIGLSLIHAFAYGLPVVLHDKEHNHGPEIAAFERGINGETFRLEDGAPGAAAAIRSILMGSERTLSMKAAARSSVQETFNVRDMAQRFIGVLKKNSGKPDMPRC